MLTQEIHSKKKEQRDPWVCHQDRQPGLVWCSSCRAVVTEMRFCCVPSTQCLQPWISFVIFLNSLDICSHAHSQKGRQKRAVLLSHVSCARMWKDHPCLLHLLLLEVHTQCMYTHTQTQEIHSRSGLEAQTDWNLILLWTTFLFYVRLWRMRCKQSFL